MFLEAAQVRTCGVASGATTRTRPPASRRLAILDSATAPAPTTRQGRAESFRNIGKSFSGFIRTVDALLAEVWATIAEQIYSFIVLRRSQKCWKFGLRATIGTQERCQLEDGPMVVA